MVQTYEELYSMIPSIFDHIVRYFSTIKSYYHLFARNYPELNPVGYLLPVCTTGRNPDLQVFFAQDLFVMKEQNYATLYQL